MELQSAGRLDGIVHFHGSFAVHGYLFTHRIARRRSFSPHIFALHGWTADRLQKRHAFFKHADMRVQTSDDIKNVLYILGPQLPCICCSVLCNTTTPKCNELTLSGVVAGNTDILLAVLHRTTVCLSSATSSSDKNIQLGSSYIFFYDDQ